MNVLNELQNEEVEEKQSVTDDRAQSDEELDDFDRKEMLEREKIEIFEMSQELDDIVNDSDDEEQVSNTNIANTVDYCNLSYF